MNNALRSTFLGAATILACSSHAQAPLTVERTTDVTMSNFRWTPAAGTFEWLTDWELEAAVSAFDSVNGFTRDYIFSMGGPSVAAAAIATPLGTVNASGEIDASGMLLSLATSSQSTIPTSLDFASTFSAATAYREFWITGGSGPVDVTFEYDYAAHLTATDAPPYPASIVDFTASMHITDGTTTWENIISENKTAPADYNVTGNSKVTYSLTYDTPYSVTYIKDNEGVPGASPEPVATMMLASLGLCAYALCTRRARAVKPSAGSPVAGR